MFMPKPIAWGNTFITVLISSVSVDKMTPIQAYTCNMHGSILKTFLASYSVLAHKLFHHYSIIHALCVFSLMQLL